MEDGGGTGSEWVTIGEAAKAVVGDAQRRREKEKARAEARAVKGGNAQEGILNAVLEGHAERLTAEAETVVGSSSPAPTRREPAATERVRSCTDADEGEIIAGDAWRAT